MNWETIWLKIKEFALMFYNFAMNEGENKFMIADMNIVKGNNVPDEVMYFFIGSFVVMGLLAIFASDSFHFFHPLEDIKEWKDKISIAKVVVFAAAVFSFHTFYKMLVVFMGKAFYAQASIDALKCLGSYINPISVMIYAYTVSTMNFRKKNIQAMFLGWSIFLTPAVLSYSTFTREHKMLYIVAASFGIVGAVLYKRCSPYISYFVLSVLYFICKFFMIYYSEEMLILTSESWMGKIGQYLACAQMDIILTFLLLLILFGYKEFITEKGKLKIKKDMALACITAAFMVCAIISNRVVVVEAVQLEKADPDYYLQNGSSDENVDQEDNANEIILNDEPIIAFVITADAANIRSGPGTDYNVVSAATKGTVFSGTGNEEVGGNGRIWYEIYINEEQSETGWASAAVIEKREIPAINKLVGVWYGEQGSQLTLEENGICYFKDLSSGEGEGTWEVDGNAVLYINTSALSYELHALLNEGYDTTSITMEADSDSWSDEVFSKQ